VIIKANFWVVVQFEFDENGLARRVAAADFLEAGNRSEAVELQLGGRPTRPATTFFPACVILKAL
jgi:hypothetical protein